MFTATPEERKFNAMTNAVDWAGYNDISTFTLGVVYVVIQ